MSNVNSLAKIMATYPLAFQSTNLQVLDYDGRVWLTAADLSSALGYSKASKVTELYQRNKDEFTDEMTAVIRLQANEINEALNAGASANLQKTVRIFSTQGSHLVAMLSRAPKAKEFRQWVLSVLGYLDKKSPPGASKPLQNLSNKAIASLIADGTCGPALTEIPAIMAACAERLSGAMCLPHFKSAPAPSELAGFIADTTALRPDQLEAIAVAALRRVKAANGANGVQRMLREVNENFMLVNEAELMLCFYNSRRLKW